MGFGKNNTGAILRAKETIALGVLVGDTAIKFSSSITLQEDFRILKAEVMGIITGITTLEGAGLQIGIANGELSVAEIGECLLVDGPSDRNDRLKVERAERFVKTFGQLEKQLSQTGGNLIGQDGGPLMIVKPRWTFSDPEGWDMFIWNLGGTLTTGAVAFIQVVYYGVWVT